MLFLHIYIIIKLTILIKLKVPTYKNTVLFPFSFDKIQPMKRLEWEIRAPTSTFLFLDLSTRKIEEILPHAPSSMSYMSMRITISIRKLIGLFSYAYTCGPINFFILMIMRLCKSLCSRLYTWGKRLRLTNQSSQQIALLRLKSYGAKIFSGTECAELTQPITAIEKAPQKKRNGCDWSPWLRTFRSAEYFRSMERRPQLVNFCPANSSNYSIVFFIYF